MVHLPVKASADGYSDDVMGMVGLASMIGTEMGQSIQALSMLKHMSPEGRLRHSFVNFKMQISRYIKKQGIFKSKMPCSSSGRYWTRTNDPLHVKQVL